MVDWRYSWEHPSMVLSSLVTWYRGKRGSDRSETKGELFQWEKKKKTVTNVGSHQKTESYKGALPSKDIKVKINFW